MHQEWLQPFQRVTNLKPSRTGLERSAKQGDSPVSERCETLDVLPSSAGHVESGVNLGGPPPKAKYSHATDSV